MFEWVTNLLRTSGVLWLRGPAGAGKTAIAQTFCEMVEKEGYLAGSFFFSRTVHGRNTAQYLFATIAYQLAIARPEIGERIEKAVASDPSITTKSIEIQLQKLHRQIGPTWDQPGTNKMVREYFHVRALRHHVATTAKSD